MLLKTPDEYSKNENRYLEKLPSLSWDAYKKGEFQDKMEKALTDQFPFRDVMTGLSTAYRKYAMLHVATEEKLYDKMKYSLLTSRYGRLKLKKKEMVYVFFSFRAGDTLSLTIE
jgi:hypothetical protein